MNVARDVMVTETEAANRDDGFSRKLKEIHELWLLGWKSGLFADVS